MALAVSRVARPSAPSQVSRKRTVTVKAIDPVAAHLVVGGTTVSFLALVSRRIEITGSQQAQQPVCPSH